MTRLAILSDVHGNLVALEAVLLEIDRLGVDAIVVAGDMVNWGPHSREALDLLRARGARMIRGNHEKDYVAPFGTPAMPAEWATSPKYVPTRWTMEQLGAERRAFLSALPDRLAVDDATLVVHGSPRHVRDSVLARHSIEELEEMYAGEDCRVAFSGHSHRPHIRELPRRRLVNVGSVGLSLDGDTRASYALAERSTEASPGDWTIEIRRVDYDVEATVRAYDNGFRQACPALVELTIRTLRTATDHFGPVVRMYRDLPDDDYLRVVNRHVFGA